MTKLYFLTSNPVKMSHAKHIARGLDVDIRKQGYYGAAYSEPRIEERDELLTESLKDAIRRMAHIPQESAQETEQTLFGKSRLNEIYFDSFFFIEDSSVIIHALSSDGRDVPGTDVKYWMRETSFTELDQTLKERGNDRSVTVRSDVCLHIPEPVRLKLALSEPYIQFTGQTTGQIVAQEFEFQTSPVFPWLDNRTFNKWFIPDGFNVPISMLPIDQADSADFRRKSVRAMFNWLQDNGIITKKQPDSCEHKKQAFFPFVKNNLILVSGYPCAGKTTIGEHLSQHNGFHHIEASDFMRQAYHQRHGYSPDVHLEKFASEILRVYPDIVVEGVLSEINRMGSPNVVVTGFRAIEESIVFTERYKGPCDIKTVFLSASAKTRFERSQNRDREDALPSLEDFLQRDEVQREMGLGAIEDQYATLVANNADIESFCNGFDATFELRPSPIDWKQIKQIRYFEQSLEGRILLFFLINELKTNDRKKYTTTEISHGINQIFTANKFETEKDNVSRYFNFQNQPYFRVHPGAGAVKFSLSSTGRSRAVLLAKHQPIS